MVIKKFMEFSSLHSPLSLMKFIMSKRYIYSLLKMCGGKNLYWIAVDSKNIFHISIVMEFHFWTYLFAHMKYTFYVPWSSFKGKKYVIFIILVGGNIWKKNCWKKFASLNFWKNFKKINFLLLKKAKFVQISEIYNFVIFSKF